MKLTIDDFKKPDKHPYNTFGSHEKEAFMAWFLSVCISAGDLHAPVMTRENEDDMVTEGYLEKVGEKVYRLTNKSIGLLYSVYAK